MFEPIRGGTRGGQAEFKWSDVSADKDREHYLGHSINAPTGRWQKNKDVHWYNRDQKDSEEARNEEIQRIKELEADALSVALGFEPAPKEPPGQQHTAPVDEEKAQRKQEKRQRKEEKRAKKLAKLERRRDRSRSRSPPPPRSRNLRRSRSPARPPRHSDRDYDADERERERERDRRRWETNARRR
ncbi:hypothetical protein Agabi119p4_5846 [Agaricus bisporus var. burnettii]|uniref:Multiple myeloma tumor-associated protein 2-like N-terminal domain-containing protein n=1 Tax=Agaricus bisporus var. burnettii TaxID=192524 RepID=A0A8H7F2F1_AGABI|nr:hypothetical protein Agabi119p4_5846 [Agaricus bisporus var. burnettii]